MNALFLLLIFALIALGFVISDTKRRIKQRVKNQEAQAEWDQILLDSEFKELAKNYLPILPNGEPDGKALTCFNCGYRSQCDYAWDLYNTDGDCLESK